MKSTPKSFAFVSFLGGLISLLWLLLIPGDAKNEWLLGFSKTRLLMAVVMGAIVLIFGAVLALIFAKGSAAHKISRALNTVRGDKKTATVGLVLSFAAFVVGILIIVYSLIISDAFVLGLLGRLHPWAFFLIVLSLSALTYLWFNDTIPQDRLQDHRRHLSNLLLLLGILFFFLIINLGSIHNKTYTTDEYLHYRYGANILALDATRFDDSKMPFSALNAILPELLAKYFIQTSDFHIAYPLSGRLFTILFSLGIAYFVYRWSRELYGPRAGFFSLLLYVLDPNIIAHSRLVTTDIFATGMIYLSLYTFWLFAQHKRWPYALLSAVTLGVSQLAKYSSSYVYPILLAIALIVTVPEIRGHIQKREFASLWRRSLSGFKNLVFFLLISLIIINIGFIFSQTFTPLNEYAFRSEMFQKLQNTLSPIGGVPVPVPYPYLEGLDWVKARERTGEGYGMTYMLGELHQGEKFTGYFIFASLLKTPIAAQIFILLAIVNVLKNHKRFDFLRNELFLFAPVVFFFLYFNFFFRAQIGLRFYLVIFPFLYVLCGSLIQEWNALSRRVRMVLVGLSIYLAASVLAAFPHYIPYFNEFVWDQTNAYKYLVDSNLDWYQAEWYLEQYRDEHPEALFEPDEPTPGLIIVSPNRLVGIWNPEKLRWLRENFEPIDTLADTYLIYNIRIEELDQINR